MVSLKIKIIDILLPQGATIIDQHVCIARWGQYEEPSSFWDRPTWSVEDDNDPMVRILIIPLCG